VQPSRQRVRAAVGGRDPVTGQFTSVDGVANATGPDERKAWIILIRDNKRGTSRISDVTYCGAVSPACPDGATRIDDVAILPGAQIWITYLKDNDRDGVARAAEDLYSTSDDKPDTDGDTVSDFDEIYRPVSVSITDREGEPKSFQARSNPVLGDTDRDNLPDEVERANHTAPDRRDTDGDGLRDDVDPDPLVYGCVAQLFRFDLSASYKCTPIQGIPGPGICLWAIDPAEHTREAKPGCSVTVHTPLITIGGVADDPLSVESMTGYASCKFNACAGACGYSNGSVAEGSCQVDPARFLATCPLGWDSYTGTVFLQCGN
jgi:hypothetical protein